VAHVLWEHEDVGSNPTAPTSSPPPTKWTSRPRHAGRGWRKALGSQLVGVLYLVAMVAVIVIVDVRFLSRHVWRRLAANIVIVLAFGAIYLAFLSQP
jgi:hypothetical protein